MKKLFVVIFFCSFSFFLFCASHEVLKGETLYSISKKYGITVKELCASAGIKDSDVIKAAKKKHILDRFLETQVPDEIYDELLKKVSQGE